MKTSISINENDLIVLTFAKSNDGGLDAGGCQIFFEIDEIPDLLVGLQNIVLEIEKYLEDYEI